MRILWLIGIVIIVLTDARLNHEGTKCGQQLCTTTEYCSPFDSQCRQCSTICNASNHNHQIELCEKDCQEYLHDRRYVLRVEMSRVEILKAEIDRLTTLVKVSLTLTIMATVLALILGGKIFIKLQRIRSAVQKIFGRSWTKIFESMLNPRPQGLKFFVYNTWDFSAFVITILLWASIRLENLVFVQGVWCRW
ncbi:protein grindelwald isoform X2 [Venturia canescens]|uniref:protein grindelwald isoform X2 n=1 Tax=Venturia canescens TaxID=32260 RepID=UPI001C9D6483|nr:protein grindelwald isoform X2 [Venturia canescens]